MCSFNYVFAVVIGDNCSSFFQLIIINRNVILCFLLFFFLRVEILNIKVILYKISLS